jgi:hypothetical protein
MMRTIAAVAILSALTIPAQAALQTINSPQGGKIIYGQVPGQTTEAGAIGYLLRTLHTQYGTRPQVGKFFEVKGTQSVAAFFNAGKITGMIIAVKAVSESVEAAAVYDDASRFETTRGGMMKTLMGVWRPLAAAEGAGLAGGTPAPLRRTCTNDRSACMSLPDGWQVSPQSGGGSMIATGPGGETAFLGFTILADDLNNPQARKTYQIVQSGGLRNTSYANGIYYALGPDLGKTFVDLVQIFRSRRNMPQESIQVASERPVPGPPGYRCAQIAGQVDDRSGNGSSELNNLFCASAPNRFGAFLAVADYTLLPANLASRDRSTMAAIFGSFQVDRALVQRQANAIAAPEIEKIHAIGQVVDARIKAAHEAQEIHNSSVYQHWDDIDRRSKAFSDYTLGYTVVATDDPAVRHATLWNEDADELMRRFPGVFHAVAEPDLLKGQDY